MLDVLGHGDEAGNGICVLGGVTKEGKVQLGSPSSSGSREVQVQELGVASMPRRGLCTDAPR